MFFLMMVLNPEVQRRAREDIDREVGLDRLPSFRDKPNLPYIECIMKEVLRYVTGDGCPSPATSELINILEFIPHFHLESLTSQIRQKSITNGQFRTSLW